MARPVPLLLLLVRAAPGTGVAWRTLVVCGIQGFRHGSCWPMCKTRQVGFRLEPFGFKAADEIAHVHLQGFRELVVWCSHCDLHLTSFFG
jgi:hypothetical protein